MTRYYFVCNVVLFALPNMVLASPNPADMTSNLISDFSPLLSLFGEQFARQFMSESTSWIDCLIFSLAPLGILTTIVGAIRVGGPSWLKALIGRARETFATAEMEIMSSTSYEVCECWNGSTIVRVMGVPKIFELLFFLDIYHGEDEVEHRKDRSFGLYTLEDAENQGILVQAGEKNSNLDTAIRNGSGHSESTNITGAMPTTSGFLRRAASMWEDHRKRKVRRPDEENGPRELQEQTKTPSQKVVSDAKLERLATIARPIQSRRTTTMSRKFTQGLNNLPTRAPNISLNLSPDKENPNIELYVAALIGILVEGAVLLVAGLISYFSPWTNRFLKATGSNSYAFPLTCIGTIALSLGMFLSAHVIEQASKETTWLCATRNDRGPTLNEGRLASHTQESPKEGVKLLWLQQGGTVNDQLFDSYAITAQGERSQIITSERFKYGLTEEQVQYEGSYTRFWAFICKIWRVKPDHYLALYSVMGTLISLVGFCLQFSGLRSLHFIVSILQLVATIFMTAVRAWLRRGLTEHPTSHKLRNQFELDWFSIRFVAHADGPWQGPVLEIGRPNEIVDDTNGGAKAVTLDQVGSDGNEAGRAELPSNVQIHGGGRKTPNQESADVMDSGVVKSEDINDNMWDIASVTPFKQHQGIWYEKNIAASQPGSAKRVLEVRKRLKTLCGWQGPATNHAISVCTAIRIVLEQLPLDKDIRTRTRFSWTLCTRWKGTEEAITLTVNKDNNNRWNVDENLMEGVISLCLLAHETRMQDPSSNLSTETIPAENAIVMAEAADSEPTSTTRSGEWLLQPDQHIRILGSFSSASQSAFEWWIKDKHGKKAKIFVKTLDAAWLEKGYRSLSLSLSSSQGLGQSPSMSQHQGGSEQRKSGAKERNIWGGSGAAGGRQATALASTHPPAPVFKFYLFRLYT